MGELAKLLGEPIGPQVAEQVALRGAKAAALALRPSPSEDRGYAYVQFDQPLYRPQGVRAVALVPGAYAEEPELFYGPFLQLGTYLKEKGMVGSEGLAFAMDLALDPINLVGFGTAGAAGKLTKGAISGLTETGKIARLISAASEGGKVRNGAVIMDRVIETVEAAGKFANASEPIMAAARAGDNAALKSVVNGALKSTEAAHSSIRPMLEALKRDRKTLGRLLENLDDFKARWGAQDLPAEAFLQPTVRGRLRAGQVEPLLSIVRPDNPLRHPLRFTRQMLGFHYANERFAVPMTSAAVEGLSKVGAGSLFEVAGRVAPFDAIADMEAHVARVDALYQSSKAAARLPTQAGELAKKEADFYKASLEEAKGRLAELRAHPPEGIDIAATEAKEAEAFQSANFKAGDIDRSNAVMAMHMARILPSTPTDRNLVDLGYEALDQATLEEAWKGLRGKTSKPEGPEFEKFKEQLIGQMNERRGAMDAERMRFRDEQMDALTSEYRRSISASPDMQAEEGLALNEAQADVMTNQMRKAMDVFSIKSLQADAFSPGNGLAARAEFQSMMSRATVDNLRAVVRGEYKGRLAAEFIAEMPQAVIEHPKLWELRDGRYFLKATAAEMEADGADFLLDAIQRSKGSKKSAYLETHLRTEGISPGTSGLISEMKTTYDMVGKNLVQNEGVLKAMHEDYFSHIFRWKPEHYAKAHPGAGAATIPESLSEDAQRQLDELSGESLTVLADKANQQKVTFEEARKFSEAQALAAEKAGWGTYEKDGVAIFGGYLDASGKSVLINRLWRDLPDISDGLTRGALGKRAIDVSDATLAKAKRIMNVEPPKKLLHLYKQMFIRPRVLTAADDPAALARLLTAEKALKAADETARNRVAARLEGKGVVGGFRLRDKATGAKVAFQGDWVLTDAIPDSLVGAKEIKGKVKEMIDGDSLLAKLRGDVTKAREDIQAKALKLAGKEPDAAQRGGLWVFEDDYNHIAEAFAIREKPSSAFLRKYDRWNSTFKSVVLIGDVFHFNVLAISQGLLSPESILKHLYDDTGKLLPGAAEGGFGLSNAAVKTAAGAAVGAAVGATGEDADARRIGTFSLVGALYGAVIGAAMNNARAGIKAAMNPANVDTLHWMGMGGWRGRPDDRSIGLLNRSLKGLRDRIAREDGDSMLLHAIDGARHLADGWDELLWSTLHNGSKHHYFQVRWGRELPKLMAKTEWVQGDDAARFKMQSDLARQIVQTSNNVFGGQTMRFLFDNPEFQHNARRILLSPDWTASRLALASGFFMNMGPAKQALLGAGIGVGVQLVESGGDPEHIFDWRGPILGAGLGVALGKWAGNIQRRMLTKGDVMAKEARRVATAAILGGYVFANAVNYGLTGRWLHENPEGKRTSIDIGEGNWVQLGKPWVEALEFAGIYEKEKYPIPFVSRLVSKGATVPVMTLRIVANRNNFGGPLILPEDTPFEMGSKMFDVVVPVPILISGPLRLGGDLLEGTARPGAAGAAGIRTLGFPVRGPGRGGMQPSFLNMQSAIQSSLPQPLVSPSQTLLESDL